MARRSSRAKPDFSGYSPFDGEVSVDLHGLYRADAEKKLRDFLDGLPRDAHRVRVVHGFHSGTVLRDLVRGSFSHLRILRKTTGTSDGETIFILK